MLNDLKDNIHATAAMHPAEYSATKADNPIIDLQGYESCVFIVSTGAISAADGTNTYTFTVEHGDDVALGDATSAASYLQGSFAVLNSTTADDVQVMSKVGYVGGKRYVRLVATEANTFQGFVSAVAILGSPRVAPVA